MSGGRGKITGKDGRPFVKGDPRINRKGRPPKLPDLKELLAKVLGEETDKRTAMERILLTLRDSAIKKGDIRASEMLKTWAYGKDKDLQEIALTLEQMDEDTITKFANKYIELESKLRR